MSAKKKLEELREAAQEAINEVHGFTDVTQQQTLEALEDLAEDLSLKINMLKEEIK